MTPGRKMKTVTNPYYLAYLNHIKRTEGEESNHGFINWIQPKHKIFREETGASEHDRSYKDIFLKWLNQEKQLNY